MEENHLNKLEKERFDSFNQDFFDNKSLTSKILAIAIHCEKEITSLILKSAKNPSKIKKWMYSPKLECLFAFDIIPEWLYHNLKILNSIRNQFAHYHNPSIDAIKEVSLKSYNSGEIKTVNLKKYEADVACIYLFTLTYFEVMNINNKTQSFRLC